MLSIALNSDGGPGHRFVVKRRVDPAATLFPRACAVDATVPYDPTGASRLLDDARAQLSACGYKRDSTGKPITNRKGEGLVGLDANNRKDRDAFQADLISLAKFGKLLFETATKVQNPGACSVAQWRREFRDAISEASVIQIARVGSANYIREVMENMRRGR